LCNKFPIQNDKKGDALLPLHYNFALEYAIKKVQENHLGLKLNGTNALLIYADDVNLLDDRIDTIKENTQTVIITKIANRFFENVTHKIFVNDNYQSKFDRGSNLEDIEFR
jgi:hypothetical protein